MNDKKIRNLTSFSSLHISSDGEIQKPMLESRTPDTFVPKKHLVGRLQEIAKPYKTFKLASQGNLAEFERLYNADNTKLSIQDSKGQAAVHKAAENGKVNILSFIYEHGGDLNIQDKAGNTPLHLAVLAKQTASIDFLLDHAAAPAIFNASEMAPLHLAVEIDSVKVLECLLKHENINPNLSGEQGNTSLHFCAYKDRADCAKKLLEYGARPCIRCRNGYFPINVAGKCAAAKTLEILIQHVEALGYKREDVLSFSDKQNNMPLHCAVNSGDLTAVVVCLDAGAPVDAVQVRNYNHPVQNNNFKEDKSTPLHFASAQGSIDMVQAMYEKQPDRFAKALTSEDILKMTPLHRAALFNHTTVVDFLIKKGADVEARDSQNRTPLLLASSKGGWRTVHCLLQNGADINSKEKENRNFLHLAIKYGLHLDNLGCHLIKGVKNLLNERDNFGCTPLHYATKAGHLVAIDDLLKLGATINLKDNEKKSPFHFAAKYGRYNTCKRLLESEMGPNIINETDGEGLSALHLAAQNGHTKIISLLMQKGAYCTRDNLDNTPLHLASDNGYTKSMRLLLTVYPNLLNVANKDGDTAIHVAAKAGHSTAVELLMTLCAKFEINKDQRTFFDCAIEMKYTDVAYTIVRHERWEEALELWSPVFGKPINGLIQHLPDVCLAVLDRCRVASIGNTSTRSYHIKYNFKYLQCPLEHVADMRKLGKDYTPMFALNTMVKYGRVQCLSHPVSQAFLNMKWRTYGSWFHMTNLVLYAIFLALLTVMVTTCSYGNFAINHGNNSSEANYTTYNIRPCQMQMLHKVSVYVVLVFCGLNVVKEVAQFIQQRQKYLFDLTNYLEWILYVSTVLYIVPFIAEAEISWQWEIGAIAIFLAWFNCLLFLQRFDLFGIYVVMFLEILRTLLQVLCVFSILLIAFGLAFFTLMHTEESRAYSTPALAILRTAMMMLELDYMASFNEPYTDDSNQTLLFGGTTILLLVGFVLLMPILLINLLIGLAVGDISAVQKDATLKRLAMQVEFQTDLERKLPQRFLGWVDQSSWTWYPNKCAGKFQSIWSRMAWNAADLEEVNDATTAHNVHLYEELYKQKQRMKELSTQMEKQHDLLRLIVQKMEIHTEEENRDEGFSGSEGLDKLPQTNNSIWSKPQIRHNLLRQSAVVSYWKNSVEKSVI
ncbi:hypothetical protein CHS0354_025776 [Potamilus streckersoni]|uniref:Ion transport domain-containing protein n=1 Tax=Potamilus streckersoni TaxID=2493646 RepID=A0AAE0TBW7_9BIVA|nr:hypothetical protein CHS0354_025776 [Potamilus streckersoni]